MDVLPELCLLNARDFIALIRAEPLPWETLTGVPITHLERGAGRIISVKLREDYDPLFEVQFSDGVRSWTPASFDNGKSILHLSEDIRSKIQNIREEKEREANRKAAYAAELAKQSAARLEAEAKLRLEAVRLKAERAAERFAEAERQRKEAERQEAERRKEFLQEVRRRVQEREELEKERQRKRESDIKSVVDQRGIKWLLHFTPIENVEGILKHGILSRSQLEALGLDYTFTDEARLDGLVGWISLSISFPNYKMFFAKRKSTPVRGGWVIVVIAIQALWELDCRFYSTNAARASNRTLGDDSHCCANALQEMFGFPEYRHAIPEFYTTDPQAEVMVHKEIPARYIVGLVVDTDVNLRRLSEGARVPVKLIPGYFGARLDHESWKEAWLGSKLSKRDDDEG